jgi:hypothetical protein
MHFFHVNLSVGPSACSPNKSGNSRIGFVTHWKSGCRRWSSLVKQALSVQRIVKEYGDVDQSKQKSELAGK